MRQLTSERHPMSEQGKNRDAQPTFHSISALPKIASVIDGLLKESEAQYARLTKAKDEPHVLDDHTVDRVTRVYTESLEMAWVFDEQLSRWQKGSLSESQRAEVERLMNSMTPLRKLYNDILTLAADLRKGTINRILEMSDEEIGLAVLTGKLKRP